MPQKRELIDILKQSEIFLNFDINWIFSLLFWKFRKQFPFFHIFLIPKTLYLFLWREKKPNSVHNSSQNLFIWYKTWVSLNPKQRFILRICFHGDHHHHQDCVPIVSPRAQNLSSRSKYLVSRLKPLRAYIRSRCLDIILLFPNIIFVKFSVFWANKYSLFLSLDFNHKYLYFYYLFV